MNISGVGSSYYAYGANGWGTGQSQGVAAQSPDELAQQLFSQMDTNGDGSVTQSELTAALQKLGPPQPPPGGFSLSGASGATDGSSADAATTSGSATSGSSAADLFASKLFSAADTDGSGTITEAELQAAMEKMHTHHHHHHAQGAESSGTQSQAAGSTSASSSTSGADAWASQLFSLADTNGTGSITEAQLKAAMQKMGPPQMMGASQAASSTQSSSGQGLSGLLAQLAMQGGLYAYQQTSLSTSLQGLTAADSLTQGVSVAA